MKRLLRYILLSTNEGTACLFVAICIFAPVIGIYAYYCYKANNQKKRKKAFDAHRAAIEKLCNGNSSLRHAVDQRNLYLKAYAKNSLAVYSTNSILTPLQYKRGVIKRSITDNTHFLSNVREQDNDEQIMKKRREKEQAKAQYAKEALKCKKDYMHWQDEVIKELKKCPNAENLVAFEIKYIANLEI